MTLGQFVNLTAAKCTAPLLEKSLFPSTDGYQNGRHCGLGIVDNGTSCCLPCPMDDWLYPHEWEDNLLIPNYLSLLSLTLTTILLLSFAVLPRTATHRHYLSTGLLIPVLLTTLAFTIPIFSNPSMCSDAITPADVSSSPSCAWTGSLVVLGGLGCVVWVFLRSLWLHIRIFWDRDPGMGFQWASIVFGVVVPGMLVLIVRLCTGFSYRMGRTCLPNHEMALHTFWIWLVVFACLAFLLQSVTTGYCFFVFLRTLRRERSSAMNAAQQGRVVKRMETWGNVRRLFVLQWRNIASSVLVAVGSVAFFVVCWTQDRKMGGVFDEPEKVAKIKDWVGCYTRSGGNGDECREYLKDFRINRTAVLVSLILASLIGLEVFVLLFRVSMLTAWGTLFSRLFHRIRKVRIRPASPQLTSLDNPEKYMSPEPFPLRPSQFSLASDTDTLNTGRNSAYMPNACPLDRNSYGTEMDIRDNESEYNRVSSQMGLAFPFDTPRHSFFDNTPGTSASYIGPSEETCIRPVSPSSHRLSQIQPDPSYGILARSYTPSRNAPSPPISIHSPTSPKYPPSFRTVTASTIGPRNVASGLTLKRVDSRKLKGRISAPIPLTFVHVNGASIDRSDSTTSQRSYGRSGLEVHPVGVDNHMEVRTEQVREHVVGEAL